MERLTVLYDGDCPVCVHIAHWLGEAPQAVRLEPVDATSPAAIERFRRIPWLGAELVVVADDGRVWAGPAAFLVTGWALSSWRWLAELAMSPLLLPLALRLFAFVTTHRDVLAPLFGAPTCGGDVCMGQHTARHAMLHAPYRS